MKMVKVPSQMTKKELTAFLLEQMLQLTKAERLLTEIHNDLEIGAHPQLHAEAIREFLGLSK